MSISKLFHAYPGSKAAFAANLLHLFNENAATYIEAFVGGGGMLFGIPKQMFQKIIINDKNYGIALLYQCLSDEKRRDEVLEALCRIEKSQENWEQAKKEYPLDKSMVREEDFVKNCVNAFTLYSQSFNCAGMSYSKSKSPEAYKLATYKSMNDVVKSLMGRSLEVRSGDVMDLLCSQYLDDEKVQYFLDPPYVGLYCGCRTNYKVNMVSLGAHIEMLNTICNARASIVICGYRPVEEGVPCIYDAILSGEQWHCYLVKKTVKKLSVVKKGQKKTKALEFIWTNHVPKQAKYHINLTEYKEQLTLDEYWEKIKECCQNGWICKTDSKEYAEAYAKFSGGKKLL